MKFERLRPVLHNAAATLRQPAQIRCVHKASVPKTRPFIPDVPTFLTLIGRGMNKYANKFPSWESLFTLSTVEMKELGIEPPRNRKYLLKWLDRYRKGALGPGADFQHVKDGQAFLKIATPDPNIIKQGRWVVNTPEDGSTPNHQLVRPKGYSITGASSIRGPYATPLPGGEGAVVKVTEGMWEHRRGQKVDGGERRKAEVQFKKKAAERRARREAELLARL